MKKNMTTANDKLIVIPTYNEAQNIPLILARLRSELPELDLLVVDDTSPDGTGAMVRKIGERDPQVHLLENAQKRGLGPAYIAGFQWGLKRGYRQLIQMDADLSHDPADVPKLLARLETNDVAVGSRYTDGGRMERWSRLRELISRSGNAYARLMLSLPYQDLTSGFNAWKCEVLDAIALDTITSKGYGFQVELKYRAHRCGYRLIEIPICFREREKGVSKMTPRIIGEAMRTILRMRFSEPFSRPASVHSTISGVPEGRVNKM